MRKLLLYTALFLMICVMVSCRPKNVLSTREMTDLLFEIHLAEAMTDDVYGPVPDNWRKGLEPDYFRDLSYQYVLKKHQVSEEDFFKSIGYYSRNLRLYTRIYADINDRFTAYAEAIENWEFHQKTEEAVMQAILQDSARYRALYEQFHILPDTASMLKNSCLPDSVTSYLDWYAHRWLREQPAAPDSFSVVDLPFVQRTDSLSQPVVADSLKTDSLVDHSPGVVRLKKDSANFAKPRIIRSEDGRLVTVEPRKSLPVSTSLRNQLKKAPSGK